jgi:hypothetical protein
MALVHVDLILLHGRTSQYSHQVLQELRTMDLLLQGLEFQ